MYSSILTGCISGIDAAIIRTEVDISTGLPCFSLVGSLGSEVKEAKERVLVALKNTGYHIPPNKITVNLSPANIRKEGTGFDVPIAVGLLQAMGCIRKEVTEGLLFIGELGLAGEIKPVKGILPIVRAAVKAGVRCCIVPYENRMEGSMLNDIQIRGVERISDLVQYLISFDRPGADKILPVCKSSFDELYKKALKKEKLDFSQVRGQEMAKRAAEIAAAGFHNILMSGPPGGGKSMIARRIPGILPELSREECLEVSAVYSVAGKLNEEYPLIFQRPFVSPHHTATYSAMVGGGAKGRPGAISLAHRGVLFLDEVTEFPGTVLDCLRQPLEDRQIILSRNYGTYVYPADIMLVCAMNPCKCGYYPDRNRCRCTENELQRYKNKISGPLMDRIDIYVETCEVDFGQLNHADERESTKTIYERVIKAREIQRERFRDSGYLFNGEIRGTDIEKYCFLGNEEKALLESAHKKMGLSARAYHRILKVSRTIADLSGKEKIGIDHLSEALSYRFTERRG